MTCDEQQKFIDCAKNERIGPLFVLMLLTGLRLGEALVLTWNDIDFDTQTLNINKTQIQYSIDSDGKITNRVSIGQTKTLKGTRKVPLMPETVNLLYELKINEEYLYKKIESNTFIFHTYDGNMLPRTTVRDTFKRITKAADIFDAHIHTLRHTFATRGAECGIELKVMQELLGHSSIKTTADIYTHVLDDKKSRSISKLSGKFNI